MTASALRRCRSSSCSGKTACATGIADRREHPDQRGSFLVTDMSREQLEAAGYGFHHQLEDGKYLIMGNGTDAFAIPAQQESPIKAAEMITEQNYNMIDGTLNNAPTMSELEARAKAGEQISLFDVAVAAKAEAKKPSSPSARRRTEKAVHPGAAQSRQGGTAEETAAAGKSTGIGGVTP